MSRKLPELNPSGWLFRVGSDSEFEFLSFFFVFFFELLSFRVGLFEFFELLSFCVFDFLFFKCLSLFSSLFSSFWVFEFLRFRVFEFLSF